MTGRRLPGRRLPGRGAAGPRRRADDTGATLMEVVIAMSITSLIMAAATAGMVQMFRVASATETQSIVQSQAGLTLLRLDRQVRYASGISQPRLVGGVQYVEYLFVETGRSTCVQLRIAGDRLQQRSWTRGAFRPTGWATLASGVSSTRAFHRIDATDDSRHQQLRVELRAVAGRGAATFDKQVAVTFTALNTDADSPAAVCTEGTQ